MTDAACLQPAQLPSFPKLAADFITGSHNVVRFYPYSPQNTPELLVDRSQQISYPNERREEVARILEQQNRAWQASEATMRNIDSFRDGAAAMVTGQQVALFGGPMYAIYKTLTAVKFAEQLTRAGTNCVPVFWLATEDHDFEEVSGITLFSPTSGLVSLPLQATPKPNQQVSTIQLGEGVSSLTRQASKLLGASEISALLESCYAPQETLGSALAKLFAHIFGKFGLITIDPSTPELHRIASPVYREAFEKADQLTQSLLKRGAQIEAAGYEPQVKVTSTSTLLFYTHDGERLPVRRVNGNFVVGAHKLGREELARELAAHPEWFSPNVLLRPVVQDYLLPTVAYIGGPSEIAYFAQATVVYEELLGYATPILPRFSATLIDPKSRRIMEQYGITLPQIFEGPERFRERLAEHNIPQELDSALEQTRRLLEENLSAVVAQLEKLDPTLVDAAKKSVGKMEYQLEHLRKKAAQAQLRRREELGRHADHLSSTIFPNKNLQEREIAGVSFLAQHGAALLDRIYDAIEPACLGHHVIHI